MHLPPPPQARDLLPPLLACLPTSFVSPQPPPALLPLLSPLLRQRLTYLSSTASRSDGWLPLLSWDSSQAELLPPIIERMRLEPHPVSGEVELEDTRPTKYRRLDAETLQARVGVEQFDLAPIYVWCESDEHAGAEGTGQGWKLAELRSLESSSEDEEGWFDSISQANDAAVVAQPTLPPALNGSAPKSVGGNDEDDDDYWASYDRTPGRTPGPEPTAAPRALTSTATATQRNRTQSELDYYARYGTEVQPAMDGHDPDEEHPEIGESTLNGHTPLAPPLQPLQTQRQEEGRVSRPNGTSLFPASPPKPKGLDVSAPRPISPNSSNGSPVDKLEQRAAEMGGRGGGDRARIAVQQHISTDIKSLFRLAKSSGMERKEFERVVRTELEVLGMMEEDD